MASENCVVFVDEIKLDTDDVALNRNVYQILMQDVVVKEEDTSIDNNNRMDVSCWVEAAPTTFNNFNGINRTKQNVVPQMPKPIKHRRCSRIEKLNNLACHRYLIRRTQQNVSVPCNQTLSTKFSEAATPIVAEQSAELSNEDTMLNSSAECENFVDDQSTDSIYDAFDNNDSVQMDNSTHIHEMDEMSSAMVNETPCTSANPLNIAFQESSIGSNAHESQIAYAVEAARNLVGMNANEQQMRSGPAEQNQIVYMNPIQAIENRCEPCAYTFKTLKNFEKHLLTKKHSQKMQRLNRQNVM